MKGYGAGKWQHKSKSLRHLEDQYEEDRNVHFHPCLPAGVKSFRCLGPVVPPGNSESVLSHCSLGVWREEAVGDESAAVMGSLPPSAQLLETPWALHLPCRENSSIPPPAPVLSLSDGLNFGSPPCLKIKVVGAATRLICSISMVMP